ncbi:MAG: hypothetical protein WDN75_16420 [Bacteroidota bacterium]
MALNYAKPDAESFGKMMEDHGTQLYKNMSCILSSMRMPRVKIF